jgi:hypothetical protein
MLVFTFLVSSFSLVLFEPLQLPASGDLPSASHMHDYIHDLVSAGNHNDAEGCSTDMAGCFLSCTFSCVQLLNVEATLGSLPPFNKLLSYEQPAAPDAIHVALYRPPILA